MPSYLIWLLCIKRLVHHDITLYILVLSCPFIPSLYTLSNLLLFLLLVSANMIIFFTAIKNSYYSHNDWYNNFNHLHTIVQTSMLVTYVRLGVK